MVKNFHQFQYLMATKRRASLTVAAIIFISIIMIFVVLQCVVFSSRFSTITEITRQYLK